MTSYKVVDFFLGFGVKILEFVYGLELHNIETIW